MSRTDHKSVSKRDKGKTGQGAMSDVVYSQSLLREAFPAGHYGSVKAALYAAQRFVNQRTMKDFTHRRARSIWEGRARRIDSEETDALREAVIEQARRERNDLVARMAALDAKLANADAVLARQKVAREGVEQDRMGG